MSRRQTNKLNPANYDMYVSNDMASLFFGDKKHPTEFDILWYLLYQANKDFRYKHNSSLKAFKDENKTKDEIIHVLRQLTFHFDMSELKAFCINDSMVKRKLKGITRFSAKTNTLLTGIDELVTKESDPTQLGLITSINGKTGEYTVDPETMYKLLLIPRTPFHKVSLITTADLPSVKSKAMYHLLCIYSQIGNIQGKHIGQYLKTLNLTINTHNCNYKQFYTNHLLQIIDDIKTHTNFVIEFVTHDIPQKLNIKYKGRY